MRRLRRLRPLYGDGFEGVKRAGEAEQRFDRAGWLEDRKRMFARPNSEHRDADRYQWDGPAYEEVGH